MQLQTTYVLAECYYAMLSLWHERYKQPTQNHCTTYPPDISLSRGTAPTAASEINRCWLYAGVLLYTTVLLSWTEKDTRETRRPLSNYCDTFEPSCHDN